MHDKLEWGRWWIVLATLNLIHDVVTVEPVQFNFPNCQLKVKMLGNSSFSYVRMFLVLKIPTRWSLWKIPLNGGSKLWQLPFQMSRFIFQDRQFLNPNFRPLILSMFWTFGNIKIKIQETIEAFWWTALGGCTPLYILHTLAIMTY